ncbi:MAG: hypothetical protein HYV03_08635, partial [Deltaproteobacteria bacterium]|nr:hypothetical protein [Deltaproteobacteria bacterium]
MVRPIGGNVPNGVNPRPGVEVPLDEAARYYRAIAEGLGGNGIPDAATQRFFLNVLSQQPQLVPEGDVSAAARLRNAVRSDLGKGVSPETLAKTWQILRRLAGPQGFTAAEAKRRADALATPASGGGQALSGSKAARLPKPRLRSLAPARLALPEPLPGETVRQQVIRLKETHPWPPGPLEAAVRFAGLFRFSVLKIHREGEHPNETDPPRVMKGVADRVLGETLLTPLGALERLFFDAEIPAGNSRGFSCRIFFTTVLKIIEAAIPEEKRPEAEELARGAVRAQMDLAGVQDDIAGPEIAFMSWVMDGVVRKYWGAPIVQETDEGGNDRTVAASSTIKDALKRRALPDRSLHPNSIRPLVDGLLALGAIGNEARLAEGRVLIVPALAAYYVRVGVWQPLEKIAPPFRRALVALYRTALLRRDPGLFRIIGADHLSLDHPYRLLAREGIVPKANLPHLNR